LRPRATGPASPAVGVAAPHGRDGVSGGDAEPYRLFCTVAASRQRWQPAGLNSFELLRSRSADSVGRPPNFLPFQRRMDGWKQHENPWQRSRTVPRKKKLISSCDSCT